ncbi:MAG: hypothetical protein H7315_10300 [Herminiimonas sp.]|nr:hypothetical protein [Herminiimonas sp.]
MKIIYAAVILITSAAGAAALSIVPHDKNTVDQRTVEMAHAETAQLIHLAIAPYKR